MSIASTHLPLPPIFDISDDDPAQYGIDHGLTLHHLLPFDEHLALLYETLRGTKPSVKDDHSKRARAAAETVLAERPVFPDSDTLHNVLWGTLPLPSKFQGLDADQRSFCERAFTTRGIWLDESDLGFSAENRRLEEREAEAEIAGFRTADLRKVWLPLRSEGWSSELEPPMERSDDVPEDGPPELGHYRVNLEPEELYPSSGDGDALEKQLAPTYTRMRDLCFSPVLLPMSEDGVQDARHQVIEPPGLPNLEPITDPASSLQSDDQRTVEDALGIQSEAPTLPSSPPSGKPQLVDAIPLEGTIRRVEPLASIGCETPMLPSSSSSHSAETTLDKQLNPMPVIEHANTSSNPPSDHFFDDKMQATMAAAVAHTVRDVQQEQYQPAEATARFDVPAMNCTVPRPRWVDIGDNVKGQFALLVSSGAEAHMPPPLPPDPNEIKLGWRPMRKTPGNPLALEKLKFPLGGESTLPYWDDDGLHNPFLHQHRTAKISSTYEDDDDDDGCEMLMSEDTTAEPDTAPPSPGGRMSSLEQLAWKRKMEQEHNSEERTSGSDDPDYHPNSSAPPAMLASAGDTATDRLMSFMARAGMDLALLSKSQPQASSAKRGASIAKPTAVAVRPTQSSIGSGLPGHSKPEDPRAALPEPPLNFPETSCTFIASLAALQLTRGILKIWPSAQFIDRDYSSHNTVAWTDKGSAQRQTVVSPLSYEADITVSPLTGIIATSVISIMQRAPVGSQQLTPICERVSRVASMYDRLVVLVSEGNDGASSVGARELAAYTDFAAWAAALPWTVTVVLVGGGKEALARWAAAVMCRHLHEGSEGRDYLIAAETSWEVLFRRAGINTYAAQLVVSAARGLFGDHEALPMFLAQTPELRADILQGLLGKTDVVERAWRVLDQSWAGVVELDRLQRVLETEVGSWDFDGDEDDDVDLIAM